MGCPVNGPGEARHADFGIAGAIKEGYIFKKGEIITTYIEKRNQMCILLTRYR